MDVVRSNPLRRPVLAKSPKRPRAKKWVGLGVVLCLAWFTSRVVWYDLRIILPDLKEQMRFLFLVYAGGLAPFIAYAYLTASGYVFKSPPVLWFHGLLFYGWLLIIFWGEATYGYALQDTLKLLFVPTAYMLVCSAGFSSASKLLERLAMIVVVYQLIRIGIFGWITPGYMYFGGVTDCYPTCYFLAKLLANKKESKLSDLLWLFFVVLIAIAGQKRSLLVAFAALILYLGWRCRKRIAHKVSIQLLILFGSIVVVSAAYFVGGEAKNRPAR